jgi:drug/metabolite transporter (DMT)-like permease
MTIALQPALRGTAVTPMLGIAMSLASFAMFTGMDTAVKVLGGHYHVLQVAFLNSLFALTAVVAIGLLRGGGWSRLRPRLWRLHLLRWSVSYLATLAIFWSYPRLPLADVYAILFATPLLVTALSVPILGERVGLRRWTAVLVGFLGILVILDPGDGIVAWPALVVLLGAIGQALNMLFIRKLGTGDEPIEAIGVVGNGLTLLVTPLVLPFVWVAPNLPDLALTAAAGLVAGSAFLLLAAAFRAAPAALVAPFQYSQMIYALLVGWTLFADRPSPRMLLGGAIVVASGLYVLHRETQRRHGHPPTEGAACRTLAKP